MLIDYYKKYLAVAIRADKTGWVVLQALQFKDVSDIETWRDVFTAIVFGAGLDVAYDEVKDEELWLALHDKNLFDDTAKHEVLAIYFECNVPVIYTIIGISLILIHTNVLQTARLYTQKIVYLFEDAENVNLYSNDESGGVADE